MAIPTPEHIIRSSRRALSVLAAVVLLLVVTAAEVYADPSVVLIAARGSGIESLSNRDIRRIFLGLKSADSNSVGKPVINLSNTDTYQKFLKNVMHMTEGAYKRKLVKRIFRNGAEAIREIDGLDELDKHLATNSGDISFIEYSAIEKMNEVEVVKILW